MVRALVSHQCGSGSIPRSGVISVITLLVLYSGACFSKVPKLFGTISGATIAFIPSQRRGSKHSNFAVLLIFLILKTCKKISFSKQADCSLTTSFSGPKISRNFRETGPCTERFSPGTPVSPLLKNQRLT